MSILEDIQEIYRSYQEEYSQVVKKARFGEGLFGFGVGPKNHPCHTQFAERLEKCLNEADLQSADPAQIRELLAFMFDAPLNCRGDEDPKYWMLLAVQKLTLDLIPLLAPDDARTLATKYAYDYPRHKRLELQNKVLAALFKQESL